MHKLILHTKILSLCCWFFFGLSLSILGTNLTIDRAIAKDAPQDLITVEENVESNLLETRGTQAYSLANYQQARNFWQQAKQLYHHQQNTTSQARVMGNLALAEYQLGNVPQARAEIKQSRQLLESQPRSTEVYRTLARILNNQGIIELGTGKTESAIAIWDVAINNYQKVGDDLGAIRVRLNQARALKTIGLYQRSLDRFTEIREALANYPDSQLKLAALRSHGNILRLVGEIELSRLRLEESFEIANRLVNTETSPQPSLVREQIKTLLALGKTLVIFGDVKDRSYYDRALEHYQQAMNRCLSLSHCSDTDLPLQINLAKLTLLLKTESWSEGIELVDTIQEQLPEKYFNQDYVDLKLSFADSLLKLSQKMTAKTPEKTSFSSQIPSQSEIIELVKNAIADARRLNYQRGESYGWGLQGQIQEQLARWDNAHESTIRALKIAQTINAPEISYLWEWQLGKIDKARGNKQLAIAHYQQAVTLLDALSHDIANIDNSIQHSFRDRIEPVYREAVALMLDTAPGETVSQENLIRARDTIESLQLAELNNFFHEACLKGKSVAIDSVDPHAAAVYPIILGDRLEIILSLSDRHLLHYSVAISQQELEKTIQQLRKTAVIRSRRSFYEPATKLYNLLITPIINELARHQIETLVFIPDGALRSIPLAALYDGTHYLIEQYNLVLNPGLQLLDPHPLQETKLTTLAVGLTQEREDFAPLEYVNLELTTIKERVKSQILLDEEFTTQALQEEIKFSDYPIVHIATHGQFSSAMEDTFLLAWDERINLKQLDRILQTRTGKHQDDIELLVLSACETAAGDRWATLGLAGMAIQAGARSTMATLWSINDRATAELMSTLYEELTTKSIGKAEAIRQAQLSLLHNPKYQHPFYWAAYTTIGNWL